MDLFNSIQDPARPHCHQGLAVSSFIGSLTSTLSLEANDKDISDDEIKDNRANDNDDTSTDLSTSDNVLAPEDASDEYDIADIPPLDDAFDRDVGDRNPTNEGEKADGEPVIYNTSTDDEALNFDPNDCTDASSTLNPTMVTLDSRESIITEITALRDRLTQLEAKINSGSHILQGTNPLGKRKQIASVHPYSKKLKKNHSVNISATRAYLQGVDVSESWVYSWQRGRGARCWVREVGAGKREEVDGGYLMCFGSDLFIDIRVNADWLPIMVRFNHDKQAFEGFESIGGRTLEVEDMVIMQLMCGGSGEHVGWIFE
ncbi:hypothetical protein VDGL01_08306 [Verticillium dahliae]